MPVSLLISGQVRCIQVLTCGDFIESALFQQVCLVQGELHKPAVSSLVIAVADVLCEMQVDMLNLMPSIACCCLSKQFRNAGSTLPGKASARAVRVDTFSGALLLTVPLTCMRKSLSICLLHLNPVWMTIVRLSPHSPLQAVD